MKRTAYITLVLSGAISGAMLTGCDRPSTPEAEESQMLTNNTYVAGRGYWHAPYRGWYPLPYNHYREGKGYYHGGQYTAMRHSSPIATSKSAGRSAAHTSSISRGGFGHSAHGHVSGS